MSVIYCPPLLLAGLWTELANVCRALRVSWNKPAAADRGAALAGAGLLAAFALFLVATTGFGLFWFLPDLFAGYRADLEVRRPAYEWIARNAPSQANVYAYDDPMLFLYSGRRSVSLPIPPRLYYHDDQAGIDRLLGSIPQFAREHQLGYVLLTHADFHRDLHERGARLEQTVESSKAFQELYRAPGVSVYRFNE